MIILYQEVKTLKVDKLSEAIRSYDESILEENVKVRVSKNMKELLNLFGKGGQSKLIRKAITQELYNRRDEIKKLREELKNG